MTHPRYIPQISLGNFITMGIFIIGLAVAWGEKNTDIRALEQAGERRDRRVEEIATMTTIELKESEQSIQKLQISHASIVERLEGIKASIDRIEKKMP